MNLARPVRPFLSNPTCDGDSFSSTLFFFILLSLFYHPFSSPLSSLFSFLSSGFTSSSSCHPPPLPSPPSLSSALLSSPLLLLCCVHVGSDSLQKGGLQPRHLTLGLQGQYEAYSWWRECKYCLACNRSSSVRQIRLDEMAKGNSCTTTIRGLSH